MQINSRAQPRTYVGQWLLAGMLDRRAERQRLSRMLNNGKSGWNADEPAVVGFACELAVRRLFPRWVDAEITAFVKDLRSRVHSTAPPDQLEAEALIRDALGDPNVDISNMTTVKIFTTHSAILGYAIQRLALGECDIEKLIIESENIAFEQGWKPPLASSG